MLPIDLVEQKTIPLRKPVKLGDVMYSEVTLREPTAGEISRAVKETSNVDASIVLISLVGAIPRQVVERFCKRDFQECDRFLESFSLESPAMEAS